VPYAESEGSGSASAIQQRRAALGGQLFIDRLLAFAGIDGPASYPPASAGALRRLLASINDADVDRARRDCFVYYLARDADAASSATSDDGMDEDGAEAEQSSAAGDRAAAFARARCLPRTWRTYMDGYWALDRGEWARATEALRDPCLRDVDFAPEIVSALTTQVGPPVAALALANELLAPRAAKQVLVGVEADAALLATASVGGMAAAFDVIRALPEGEQHAAREAVWCWALGAPRSPAGKGVHAPQPTALRQLLHLALWDDEHAHLVALLARPPRDITPASRSLLHDLVTLRLVHAGKYEETLALDKELAGTADAAGAADRQRRREMVREFIDILPAAQRRILLGDAVANGAAAANGAQEEDVDMASSWVAVPRNPSPPAPAVPATPAKSKPSLTPALSTPQPTLAPTPVRATATASAVRSLQAQGTPARSGAASPFGGPPRFPASPAPAAGSRSGSPTRGGTPAIAPAALPTPGPSAPAPAPAPAARLASPPRTTASPFNPPAKEVKAKAKAKATRKPKRVIDDTPRRPRRHVSDDEMEAEATPRAPSPIPEDAVVETPAPAAPTRRTRRTVVPPAATRTSRRRQATAEPEDAEDDDPLVPGAFAVGPPSRNTRAASAALSETDVPEKKRNKGVPAAKPPSTRRTRATSEMTDDGVAAAVEATPARRTRRAAASERGSPTPSVASPTRTRRTRAREPSATPAPAPAAPPTTRATRSRKAKE
jgi:hypothetical protein